MWVKKYVGSKKFLVKKRFGSKKILVRKNFMDQKINWVKRNFWSKNFLGSKKIFLGQKNFCSKIFWGVNRFRSDFFCLKKTGRVTPMGRKIVGLKFCWVVLTCPKDFLVKKKFRVKVFFGSIYLGPIFFCLKIR